MGFLKKIANFRPLVSLALQIFRSKVTGKRIPIIVSLHVTNKCNMRCSYCYANYDERFDKKTEDFSTAEIKSLIDDMYSAGTRWLVLLGGEPLLRKDIGFLVKYIKNKGMLCEIVTNGQLVKQKIDEIKDVDLLCISLDGDEEANDSIRGKGTYQKAVEGLKIAKERGIRTRLHATLSRANNNARSILHLEYLSRLYQTNYGYSSPILHDYNQIDELFLPEKEAIAFWQLVRKSKKLGGKNYYSYDALNYVINWPFDPAKVFSRKDKIPRKENFNPKKCFAGKRSCYIDSEGVVYPCIIRGIKNGVNAREVGFKKAWKYLGRFSCGACAYLQYVEFNNLVNLSWSSILLGLKTFLI